MQCFQTGRTCAPSIVHDVNILFIYSVDSA